MEMWRCANAAAHDVKALHSSTYLTVCDLLLNILLYNYISVLALKEITSRLSFQMPRL